MNTNQSIARTAILDAVQKNQPDPRPMPLIPHFGLNETGDLIDPFCKGVVRMAGKVISDAGSDLDAFVRNSFPDAKVICSAVPECNGTMRPADLGLWSEAGNIDVAIVRSPMGVAETGSVLLSDRDLHVNTIAFLSRDLVVLLDPTQIVRNIHDAYRHPDFASQLYSVLMTGPSGSGDIGAITVHPAQGVRSLTVILTALPIVS